MQVSEKNSGWEDLIFIPPGKSFSQHIQDVSKKWSTEHDFNWPHWSYLYRSSEFVTKSHDSQPSRWVIIHRKLSHTHTLSLACDIVHSLTHAAGQRNVEGKLCLKKNIERNNLQTMMDLIFICQSWVNWGDWFYCMCTAWSTFYLHFCTI